MQYIIVVGDIANGVAAVHGPFDSEEKARDYAIGHGDSDRFENWFAIELTEPDEDEDEG